MHHNILKAKIHTVRVTEGPQREVTRDPLLLTRTCWTCGQKIKKVRAGSHYQQPDIETARVSMTYVLPRKRGSGEVCMNGGAALHAKEGDIVSRCWHFAPFPMRKLDKHIPLVVFSLMRTTTSNRPRRIPVGITAFFRKTPARNSIWALRSASMSSAPREISSRLTLAANFLSFSFFCNGFGFHAP